MHRGKSLIRLGIVLATALAVSACGLPRSGPYYEDISASDNADYPFEIVPMTPDVASKANLDERRGFSVTFLKAGAEAVTRIARGDVLAITVWENADEGLLNPAGIGATQLPNSKVDERGRIFVPYIGLVQAAGRTIGDLRETIRESLAGKTVDPQIDVFPFQALGRQISVQGVVNAPGLYPIERHTTHILPMMAKAGGVALDPEIVRLKLRRGRLQGEIWLADLYDQPENDVHLRNGDAIIAERDRRLFTALGAVGSPATIQFPTRDVSVIQALGIVGGLREQSADPTGVFLFREEPVEIARRLFPGQEIDSPLRVAYIVDLTQPAGMFLARDFLMRDRDTIYVTTAPFVRWLKILQAISPIINFGGSARNISGL
ncbi:MAG: polysaccharide biosynthesis/export family protein [Pseudomonadota bacterium]